MNWYDIFGLLGVFLIVVSYLLLQIDRLASDDIAYSLANLAGALFIIISLIYEFNLSAFIVETFWLIFSAYGLFKIIRKNKS